jgi:hypothetical protein
VSGGDLAARQAFGPPLTDRLLERRAEAAGTPGLGPDAPPQLAPVGAAVLLELQHGPVVLAEVKRELKQWRPGEVAIELVPSHGMWRVLKVNAPEGSYGVITSAGLLPSRRKALRFILNAVARPPEDCPGPDVK